MAGLANTIPSSYPMPGVLCRELTLTWGPQHCAYGNQPPGVSNPTTQLTAGDMLLGRQVAMIFSARFKFFFYFKNIY